MMVVFKSFKLRAIAAAVAVLVGSAIAAHAATVATCPDVTLGRTIALDPSSGCYAYGDGNINGNPAQDPILNGATTGGNTFNLVTGPVLTDLVVLDKSDNTGSVLNDLLSGDVRGPSSGTITVTGTSGYTDLVLGLKVGNNLSPSWSTFLISGDGDYTFSVNPQQGASMSHVMLYGIAAVPIPAGGLLLIGGLGGLMALRRRRKPA